MLLEYLDSTAVSPIQREFVECEEPICGDVSHSTIENSTSCFYYSFEGVGKQHLDSVQKKLFDLLKKIQDGSEKFDMERMHTLLKRQKVRILSVAETSPHKLVIGPIICHFLYGNGSIEQRARSIPLLEEFITYEETYWRNLIDRYITGDTARYVTIVGEPSPELMKTMAKAESDRIAEQKEKLKEKLATMGDTLKKAVEINERQASKESLTAVAIPSPDHIKYHSIERFVVEPEAQVPFRIQYDNIKTNFITIHVLLNSSQDLTKKDRLYLPVLSEMILKTPIMRNGELVPYEKVVAELYSDTIAYGCGMGISSSGISCGAFSMLLGLQMQVEVDKYEKGVHWFHELLYNTVFTPERIKSIATQIVSDISQYKRSGSKVASLTMNSLIYQSNSNQWAANFLRQQTFLKALLKDLKENPAGVQDNLIRVRNLLTKPGNLLVHIGLNKNKLDAGKLHEPWQKFVPESVLAANPKEHIKFDQIIPCHKLVEFIPSPKAAIVGIGSAESSYLHLMVKSIDSLKHPDLAAILVLINYLTQIEGPLWRTIRGLGLSYNYDISLSTSNGMMTFLLYKSSQLVAAYDKTIEIIDSFLKGGEEFQDNLIDSARSGLVYTFVSGEKSPADKSVQSLVAYLRDLDMNFNKDLIKKVAQVTKDDLRRVGAQYLKPLFEDKERRMSVCCNTSKVEEVAEGLARAQYELERLSIEESTFLNSVDTDN
jgi:Zn-dependent M16 (insulinase) family peptidase